MGNIDINHDGKVLEILKRRLRQRELQSAKYGISADPSITIEIEDLKKEIRSLEWKIDRLSEDRYEARTRYATSLSEIITGLDGGPSDVKIDLTGKWKLQEIYDFGRTTGDVRIHQDGNHLSGTMTIEDNMDDGETLIIQEDFSGTVRETTVFLYGERVYGVGRFVDDYEPDQWIGLISSFALLTIELPGATDLGYNWTAAPHPHAGGSHGSARSTPRYAPDAISAVVQWRVHPAPMEVLRDRTPGARAV